PDRADSSSVVTSDWIPAVDVRELEDRYLIIADVPGVLPEDIEINMDNGILSIAGTRQGDAQGSALLRRAERPQGHFHRRFSLPESVDAAAIGARCRHGVLEITIPKLAREKPRRIKVEG